MDNEKRSGWQALCCGRSPWKENGRSTIGKPSRRGGPPVEHQSTPPPLPPRRAAAQCSAAAAVRARRVRSVGSGRPLIGSVSIAVDEEVGVQEEPFQRSNYADLVQRYNLSPFEHPRVIKSRLVVMSVMAGGDDSPRTPRPAAAARVTQIREQGPQPHTRPLTPCTPPIWAFNCANAQMRARWGVSRAAGPRKRDRNHTRPVISP